MIKNDVIWTEISVVSEACDADCIGFMDIDRHGNRDKGFLFVWDITEFKFETAGYNET
jgi:hypothetical protein